MAQTRLFVNSPHIDGDDGTDIFPMGPREVMFFTNDRKTSARETCAKRRLAKPQAPEGFNHARS